MNKNELRELAIKLEELQDSDLIEAYSEEDDAIKVLLKFMEEQGV